MVISSYGSKLGVSDSGNERKHFRGERHDGVDIRAKIGYAVIASASGRVSEVRKSDVAGMLVEIEHVKHRRWTRYGHLRSVSVILGRFVKRGQKIGEVGLFPYSGGVPHVHWMLCMRSRCYGYGREGGTEDPIEITDGCFDPDEDYATDRLVLTYPVDC